MIKELEGKKVRLRQVTMNDVSDNYVSWLNDKEVTSGLVTSSMNYTKEMLHDYIAAVLVDDKAYMFMIHDKITDKVIGTIKLSNVDKATGICNLGIMIGDRNFWGGGFGTDALATAIDFAFNELNVRKICESVHSNNPRALVTDLKLGFRVEGVLKDQLIYDGKYIDKILIALFAKDWVRK